MEQVVEVPSPFLPGTNIQYAWDSTSLGWLKTCPRLYYYEMIEGWKGHHEGIHLRFGIEIHQVLQDYDIFRAQGISHEDAVHDVIQALLLRTDDFRPKEEDHGKAARYKSRENLIFLSIAYMDHYKDDPAKTFIMADGKPAVELSFRFELSYGPAVTHGITDFDKSTQPYLLCGHLDRVVTFNDELFTMDRKTTGSTPGQYFFDNFNPHNQMSLYTLAGQIVLGATVRGVIIDAIQCAIDYSFMERHPPFQRGLTYRTKDQLEEWLENTGEWLAKAEDYATRDVWPMNDTACDKFGGCKYRDICAKSPQVRDKFLSSNFVKGERWNPLLTRG